MCVENIEGTIEGTRANFYLKDMIETKLDIFILLVFSTNYLAFYDRLYQIFT